MKSFENKVVVFVVSIPNLELALNGIVKLRKIL